jgi:hypothetical protein
MLDPRNSGPPEMVVMVTIYRWIELNRIMEDGLDLFR